MNGSTFAMILIMGSTTVLAVDEHPPPIRVGVLHSLTGSMAANELPLVDAISMAVDEINNRGGVLHGRRLEIVKEDGAAAFAAKAEKLIVEDKVACIFGCWTSASRQAVRKVVEKHNSLLWYPVPYEGRESSPNVYYVGATPNQQIIPAVEWCRREFGAQLYLVGSDHQASRVANETIRQRLGDYGEIPVGEEYMALDSDNVDEIVTRIVESRPHIILNSIVGSSNRVFFESLSAAVSDADAIPVLSFSVAEQELLEISGELADGHYCSRTYFQSLDTVANERFVREFKRRFGEGRVTDDRIEAAYTQVYLFARAIELAESTEVNAIRSAARGLIFPAPGGLIRIDPRNQHTWKSGHIGKIKPDGQLTIVWSSEEPLPPRPYLPATFLNIAHRFGSLMFTSISTMMDLEAAQLRSNEADSLLQQMANVRAFLSEARTDFRSAATVIHFNNRQAFEDSWQAFERRLAILLERTEELTEPQKATLEQFKMARDAFADNAAAMFKVIYSDSKASSEVLP